MEPPTASPPATLLARATSILRLPGSPADAPTVSGDGDGFCCPRTGRVFRVADGVLDLLGAGFEKTLAQKPLDVPFIAGLYDRLRPRLAWVLGLPAFEREVADVTDRLAIRRGDIVLDVACGHGNFTLELARRVGSEGLVIGIDIAGAMLRRAADHVRASGLENVLLVRGDAMALPVADASLAKLNCSGGLHGIPDLRRALAEFARVSRVGGRLTASGFAAAPDDRLEGIKRRAHERFDLHFVRMPWLREELENAGYEKVETEMPSSWIGYCWARRGVAEPAGR